MNLPWVYISSHSWTPLPPPFPYHLSGSSPCTSPKLPVSCIEPRLAIRFLHGHTHQQKNSLISTFFLPNGFIFSSHRRVISTWHSVWPVIASKCHSFHHREGWIIFSALKTPREELLLTLFGSDIHLSASQLWQEKAWCWLNWQLPPEPHSWNGVGVYACMPCRFSRDQLCDAVDYRLPGSSVHGILQARILEWVAISFSRGSSRPRDWTHISYITYTGRQILYH